jgi:hypothetical protein
MPIDPGRNDVAEKRNMISPTVYEHRAALALRSLITGPNADKLTARALNCSVRMAQHLRNGRHWTIQRLTQASAVLGVAFDTALSSPEQHYSEMTDIAERLARLEMRLAEMDRGEDARLAPEKNAGTARSSGTHGQ